MNICSVIHVTPNLYDCIRKGCVYTIHGIASYTTERDAVRTDDSFVMRGSAYERYFGNICCD